MKQHNKMTVNKKFLLSGRVRRSTVYLIFSVCLSASVMSQQTPVDSTLIRTVVVEQEYNPNILDASKINILPNVEEPSVAKGDIEYSQTLRPATSFGNYQQLMPLTRRELQPDAHRGYARFGYGNKGNIDAKLSYLFDFTSRDRLGISASLDGMNGKLEQIPPYYNPSVEMEDWKAKYYRTNVTADYLHKFNNVDMNIRGVFESDAFNYHDNVSPAGTVMELGNDKQNHTKGEVHLGFNSTTDDLPLRFMAEANYLYFNKKHNLGGETNREQIVRTKAEGIGDISDEQMVGVKFEMNNLFYSLPVLSNYTTVDLNPYYRYVKESAEIRLGAHVDLAFGQGKTVQVAPDIRGQYNFADNYLVYLNATGGRQLNDYRQLELGSPYWLPVFTSQDKNTYIPLDASLGLSGSPATGFWFNLFAGYQIRKDDLNFVNDFGDDFNYAYNYFTFADTKAFYFGAGLKYSHKDLINISLDGRYNKWDADEDFVLLMKPQFDLNASIEVKLLSNIYLDMGYNYVSRPEVTLFKANIMGVVAPMEYQMSAINNLSFGATYKFNKNFSAFVRVNNVLNKEYQYYYSYPSQKLNFMAGISASF